MGDWAETKAFTMTVTTDCTCEPLLDDDGQVIPTGDMCFGCYTSDREDILAELDYWLSRHDYELVKITNDRMGWTRSAGWLVVDADPERIFEALTVNGDYRLEFYWDDEDMLTARRYSHDENTGSGLFVFEPVSRAMLDDDGLGGQD